MKKKKEKTEFEEEKLSIPENTPEKEEEMSASGQSDKGDDTKIRNMEEDINLFHSLFPHVQADKIPKEVWDRVEQGESLAASFALYTVQEARRKEEIEKVNEKNEKMAPPRIRHDGAESEYFSPEAVKAMSPKEIKKHYDAILQSMEKWN